MDPPADMVINLNDGLTDPHDPEENNDSPLSMLPASLNPSQGPSAPAPPVSNACTTQAPATQASHAPQALQAPQLTSIPCCSTGPIASQVTMALPSIFKLNTSRVTRIDQTLDSKRKETTGLSGMIL